MYKELSPQELKEILESGKKIRLIDVREQWEYDLVALADAECIPLGQLEKRISELSKQEKIILYCHHGPRGVQACSFLAENGFEDVNNLEGGIEAWAASIDPNMERY